MTFSRNPKAMAKSLRNALARQDVHLSHSQSLEVVAQQLGFKDWNTVAAAQETQDAKPLPQLKLPFGWIVAGTQARDYSIGLDEDLANPVATIRAIDKDAPYVGFATLMQSVTATAFRGKRLQLLVELKTLEVPDAATVWMRADDAQGKTVAFDNMEKRAANGVLNGTVDWTQRQIVLDVPKVAESLHYGFYLRGAGQCWARAFDLQTVDADVAVTSIGKGHLDVPTNLTFEKAH